MNYLNDKNSNMSLRGAVATPSGMQQSDFCHCEKRGDEAIYKIATLTTFARNDKSRGFALLYAILIIFLFMITASAIAFSALSDIRQYNQAKSSLGALMAAQSGIEAGLASPSGDCTLQPAVPIVTGDSLQGSYILKICPSPDNYIESTGIYGGVDGVGGLKIKLRADSINDPVNLKIYQVGI